MSCFYHQTYNSVKICHISAALKEEEVRITITHSGNMCAGFMHRLGLSHNPESGNNRGGSRHVPKVVVYNNGTQKNQSYKGWCY